MVAKVTALKFQSQVRHFHSGLRWLDHPKWNQMYPLPSKQEAANLPKVDLGRGDCVIQGRKYREGELVFRGNLVYTGQGKPKARLIGGMFEGNNWDTRYPLPHGTAARNLPIVECLGGGFIINGRDYPPRNLVLRRTFLFTPAGIAIARIKEHHK